MEPYRKLEGTDREVDPKVDEEVKGWPDLKPTLMRP
jgi:hypothetical protein